MNIYIYRCVRMCALVGAIVSSVSAQSNFGLQLPTGVPVGVGPGTMFMTGGTGTGVGYEHNIHLANPANIGNLDRTVFSSLGTLDFVNIHDNGRSTNHVSFLPRQISFGFGIERIGGFGFSVDRRFDATTKFQVQAPGTEIGGDTLETVDFFRQALSRNGGLTVWQIGWGRAFGRYLRVGIGYERAYLNIDDTRIYEPGLIEPFDGLAGTQANRTARLRDSTTTRFGGNGFRLGVMVPLGNLTLGASGEYFLRSTARQDRQVLVDTETFIDEQTQFNLQLPPTLSLGASYRFSPEWFTAVDLSATLWDWFEGDGLVQPGSDQAVSMGLGAEYIPAPNILSPRYWETMRYRAGLRFGGLPAEGSREFALGFGVGLPLRGNGLFDIGVEYGNRWSSRYEGIREEVFSIALGINGGRSWTRSTGIRY